MEGVDRRATPAAPIAELIRAAAALGLALSETAITRFQVYIDTLLLWRRRLSLTAAATPDEIVRAHIVDSLMLCRFIQPGMRVADLGSGAGFPGIPLAIVCDRARVSLVESRRKKASFLREVVRAAGLANVEVIEERAEHLAEHGVQRWDVVVSRAVWALPYFLDLSDHLVARGGLVIAMKGPKDTAEVPSYHHGPLVPADVVDYQLRGGVRHRLIIYRRP